MHIICNPSKQSHTRRNQSQIRCQNRWIEIPALTLSIARQKLVEHGTSTFADGFNYWFPSPSDMAAENSRPASSFTICGSTPGANMESVVFRKYTTCPGNKPLRVSNVSNVKNKTHKHGWHEPWNIAWWVRIRIIGQYHPPITAWLAILMAVTVKVGEDDDLWMAVNLNVAMWLWHRWLTKLMVTTFNMTHESPPIFASILMFLNTSVNCLFQK